MVSGDPPSDRFEFWVGFVFSAIFGTLLAFVLWWSLLAPPMPEWFWILPAPFIFGLSAAWWAIVFGISF
jgi:hypothetical protein